MTDIRELSGKKKVKKRLGAWERYLVCRQMRFVFLLGNSTFDPMQQSEAAAFWSHFWSRKTSKKLENYFFVYEYIKLIKLILWIQSYFDHTSEVGSHLKRELFLSTWSYKGHKDDFMDIKLWFFSYSQNISAMLKPERLSALTTYLSARRIWFMRRRMVAHVIFTHYGSKPRSNKHQQTSPKFQKFNHFIWVRKRFFPPNAKHLNLCGF